MPSKCVLSLALLTWAPLLIGTSSAGGIIDKFIDLPPDPDRPPAPVPTAYSNTVSSVTGPPTPNEASIQNIQSPIPPDNYLCFSYKGGPPPDQAQRLVDQMKQNIAGQHVAIDGKTLARNGLREGGCQLIYSIESAVGAYLCAQQADASTDLCGAFNGTDVADAVQQLKDHCVSSNGVGGTAWVNGKYGQTCKDRTAAYYATVRGAGTGQPWRVN